MASAELQIEPTNEIKLSSWGMMIARIPEIKTKRLPVLIYVLQVTS